MTGNFFRLKNLDIEGFKNIKSLNIDFTDKNGITILIGNNGCGKSNILEAVSSIFAGLYQNKLHKPNFDYIIEYEINGNEVKIQLKNGIYQFSINGSPLNKTEFNKKPDEYLPKNVIACYSGDCSRLWDKYYSLYYNKYISNIKNASSIPDLPMLYISKYNIDIALLTLFFYDFDVFSDVKTFCEDVLKIKAIESIEIDYNVQKIKEWKDNSVIQMIKHLNSVDDISILSEDKLKIKLQEFKEKLSYVGGERELFKLLFAATMPKTDKVITKIVLQLELQNGEKISSDDLSEGERKYLLMKVILETLATENSFLLFDEPDSHIHISRKAELKDIFEKYNNRENIITTHSPTLAVSFDESHIEGLGLDTSGYTQKVDRKTSKIVSEITNGLWNVQEQHLFLASNKPMTLLVEGETDKLHIEEAYKRFQSSYPDLKFDVYYFGSADNIPPFITGLRTSNANFGNRKFVAVFDNDKEGHDCLNKTQVEYEGNKKNKKNLYAITLPLVQNGTIENMYPSEKFAETYKNVVNSKLYQDGLIKDYSESILKETKKKFSEDIKNFNDSDFDGFKPLLDKLLELFSLN